MEARRTRHVVVRLDRGDELPSALIRALDELEIKAGWVSGHGVIETAEIAAYDAAVRGYGKARRIDSPSNIVTLNGNIALYEGAASAHLLASFTRDGELGLETFAGEILWARALMLEIHVIAFDDLSLNRAFDDRTGLAVLGEVRASGAEPARSVSAEPARPAAIEAVPPAKPRPVPSLQKPPAFLAGEMIEPPTIPARPVRPHEDIDFYPDIGDLVEHFHFGECEVISSDGDRIRLRQQRDGRVREVALTMLRIEPPSTNPETGKRTFRLARKN